MMCINPSIRSTPVVLKCIETCRDIMGVQFIAERGKRYFQVCYVCTSESGRSSSVDLKEDITIGFGMDLPRTSKSSDEISRQD
jgi:hypothetical protein